MAKHKFKAVLKRPEGVGTWTYLDIPFSVVDAFGCKGQAKVKGTINGCPFRSSALPHGDGTHYVVVKKEIRDAIGATQGSTVAVLLEEDTAVRTVTVPADLKRTLTKNKRALEAFQALSFSHQKEFVDWIEGAKQAVTRETRIAKAMTLLHEGLTPKSRRGEKRC